jgi:hypothetical protein
MATNQARPRAPRAQRSTRSACVTVAAVPHGKLQAYSKTASRPTGRHEERVRACTHVLTTWKVEQDAPRNFPSCSIATSKPAQPLIATEQRLPHGKQRLFFSFLSPGVVCSQESSAATSKPA